MAVINPHINFNGNAEEAFNFYKSLFGGAFSQIIRFKEIANEEYPIANDLIFGQLNNQFHNEQARIGN